jgi:hypothetical protein
MNVETIYQLLCGNFTYEDMGIRDRATRRFFTCNEIVKLFEGAGYSITKLSGGVHPLYTIERYKTFWDQLSAIPGVAEKQFFDTYRYLIVAQNRQG